MLQDNIVELSVVRAFRKLALYNQTNLLLDTEESFPKTSPLALGSTISEEKTTQIQSIKFPKKVHLFTIHELHNFDSPSLSTIFLTDTKHINETFFPPPY